MPAKPNASSKGKAKGRALDRPFPPDLLRRGREMAAAYQIVLTHEEGHWYGRGLELPHVFGDGATEAECVADTRDALAGMVAHLLERGERAPAPSRTGRRNTQVNVRLTMDEKLLLENVAWRKGFNGLSEFIRAAALDHAK